MKKVAVAIPVAALLAGLFLFLWQRGTSTPPAPPHRHSDHEAAPHAEEHRAPKVVEPSPPIPSSQGIARLLVTGRGKPLPGAEIVLMRQAQEARMRFTTGPDGIRSILQIPPGTYIAYVTHPQYLPGETRFEVPPGKRADATIDLQAGARIRGLVTTVSGAPLPDTQVLLIDGQSLLTVGPQMSAKTDAEGRYELPPIPTGDFGVRFRHERHRVQDRTGFQVVTGAEEFQANATLEAGRRVEGRVVDEQGQPIAGAEITIANPKSGGLTTSGADGRFAVYGLSEEPVNGLASKKGFGQAIHRGIPPDTLNLEFRLPKGGAVSGRVLAEPAPPQFYVVMSRYDEELGKPLRVVPRSFTNAPEGAFMIDDLSPGLYWVEVECEGYEATDRPQVNVTPGQTTSGITVRLRKT